MLTEKDYCDYESRLGLRDIGYPMSTCQINDGPIQMPKITLYEALKWLRKERGVNVFVMQIVIEGSGMHRYASYIQLGDKIWLCRYYSLYEEALLEGIKETVKILKEYEADKVL